MKTDFFQSCGHCWVFQICWQIECSTFTASSFRIWNSSTGIPSPPLALFVVMLPKAHLTFHSRMPGSRWVSTPSWLSGSWRSFLFGSCVYSCCLFSISSASGRALFLLSGKYMQVLTETPIDLSLSPQLPPSPHFSLYGSAHTLTCRRTFGNCGRMTYWKIHVIFFLFFCLLEFKENKWWALPSRFRDSREP